MWTWNKSWTHESWRTARCVSQSQDALRATAQKSDRTVQET